MTTAPLLRAQVSWALRRRGIRPFAVVAGYLDDLLGYWGDAVNVVYSTDDHVAGAELMGLSADRIRAQERQAAARANVVVVVSTYLAEHWAALGSVPPVLIPNGSLPPYASGVTPQPAVTDMPGPVIGLIGQLTQRIDLPVLTAVADAGVLTPAGRALRPAVGAGGLRRAHRPAERAVRGARPRRGRAVLPGLHRPGSHSLLRQRVQPRVVPHEDARVLQRRPARGEHGPARLTVAAGQPGRFRRRACRAAHGADQ